MGNYLVVCKLYIICVKYHERINYRKTTSNYSIGGMSSEAIYRMAGRGLERTRNDQ